MKSNIARRIDDTDDPRLPHPIFPRSDGQQESRRIFYIRLFRKRTPDGPIEFCPVRFLASESRDQGWAYFVNRFGGGYYRAEATSSANKKQAYTGGSSLRWFHFAGPSKPFPLPGTTVQEVPAPSPPAMPSATWNEVRALLKSERRFFAEQLEAERKAGDERMRAWMEHAEKMAQAESARLLAMEAMLREEREHGKRLEARLIEALKEHQHVARIRELEARQAATRITETMCIHAENEAMRIAYDEGRPVKIPRARKPRSPSKSRAGSTAKIKKASTANARPNAPIGVSANAQDGDGFASARFVGRLIAQEDFERRKQRMLSKSATESERGELYSAANKGSGETLAAYAERRKAEIAGSHQEARPEVIGEPSNATSASIPAPQDQRSTDAAIDNIPPALARFYRKQEHPETQAQERARMNAEPPTDEAIEPGNHVNAPSETQAPEEASAPNVYAGASAHEGISERTNDASAPTPSSDGSKISGDDEEVNSPFFAALFRARQRLETQPQSGANTNTETAREAETTPAQEAPSIHVQRFPPRTDPEGMTTIRTLHGWLTIPSEWLRQDITDDVRAMLSNLLHQRILIGTD